MSDSGTREIQGFATVASFPFAQAFARPGTRALLVGPSGDFDIPVARVVASIQPTLQGGEVGGVTAYFVFPNQLPREWGPPPQFTVVLIAPFDGFRINSVPFFLRVFNRAALPPPVPPAEDPAVGKPDLPSNACTPPQTVIPPSPISSPCSSGSGGTAGPRSFF
jgi:hypothetical protein